MLEHGETVLTRLPGDLPTQVAMAAAAGELGLADLALWLLEQARVHGPDDPAVNRALAGFFEERGDYRQATAYWEKVSKALPHDGESRRKMNDLAALETLERSRYRDGTGRGSKRAGG